MKKIPKITAAASAAVLLTTGCTFGSNIDNLMAPPKLSGEQEQIYKALTDAAVTSISLKYPKSGKYLSAFIVEDIDGDNENEAIVFYEKSMLTVEENPLRMNILDQEDGKWRSVTDTNVKGAEIEKVMISKLGSNDRVNIIIGTSLINRSEKNVSIYHYSHDEGTVEPTFSAACSFIDVTDLDSDGENEFLLLSGSTDLAPTAAEAYKLNDEGKYLQYRCELSGSFTEFDSLLYGRINSTQRGLYIDAHSGTGSIQTDIIYMDKTGLNKVFKTPEASLSTVRPAGCASFDVDGDGILEIPVQSIAPGYEDTSEGEQMKLTSWMFTGDDGTLKKKCSSYYSVNDGYIFVFPDKWQDKVTVKRDIVNDEIVFCAYSGGKTGRELLRICCAVDTPSREDRLSNGYMFLRSKGEAAYLAYIPQDSSGDGLTLSAGETAVGFRANS